MLDLTKILKVGDTVYSVLHGIEAVIERFTYDEILVRCLDCTITFNHNGAYFNTGECQLFPSKEIRTWENYCPFKKGDIVLVWDANQYYEKRLELFYKYEDGKYYVGYLLASGEFNRGVKGYDNCELYDPTKYNL